MLEESGQRSLIIENLMQRIVPSLITLLSKQSEIAWVTLKTIRIMILNKQDIFQKDFKLFFCNYGDPIYIKQEKLEILILLSHPQNIDQILFEIKEYCNDVDVDFTKKCI